MLKQLIQLFAEKFLTSKKEWVSHQRNTDYSKSITLSLPNEGNYKQYVPPCDGMFVMAQSGTGKMYIECDCGNNRFYLNQEYSYAYYQGLSLQVNKGQTVSYKAEANNRGSFSRCQFVPFVSGS